MVFDIYNNKPKMFMFVFLVDTSKHVNQMQMDKVNSLFTQIITELKSAQENSKTCELKIAVMEFSQKAKWKTLPTLIQEYEPELFIADENNVNFDNVLKEVDTAFNRNKFFNYDGKMACPEVFLVTSGQDDGNSKKYVDKLYENGFLHYANRHIFLTDSNKFELIQTIASNIYSFVNEDKTCIYTTEDSEDIINSIKRFSESIRRREEKAKEPCIRPMDYNISIYHEKWADTQAINPFGDDLPENSSNDTWENSGIPGDINFLF